MFEALLFKAVQRVIIRKGGPEREIWVLTEMAKFNGPVKTAALATKLRQWGYSYDTVIRALKGLSEKGLSTRIKRGYHKANFRPIVFAAFEIMDEQEEKNKEWG